jgi:hypothetical protein
MNSFDDDLCAGTDATQERREIAGGIMGAPIISYAGHHIPVCRVDAADTYGRLGANPRRLQRDGFAASPKPQRFRWLSRATTRVKRAWR